MQTWPCFTSPARHREEEEEEEEEDFYMLQNGYHDKHHCGVQDMEVDPEGNPRGDLAYWRPRAAGIPPMLTGVCACQFE